MVDPTNILDGIKFPTFQEERIFIASSGDLSTLRKALYEWLNGFLRRHTSTRQIQAYEWETCISDAPFDQRITMQENLGRPSDPNCVATICLLGERIGNPLNEIDPITIIGFDDWTSDKNKYQLIFPWPKDLPSQLECVSKGGFPLTGSVFEYLDAQGAGKNIYLAYFANTPISIEQPQISLNGEYWKSIREADFKSQHPQNYQEQQIKWRDSEYKIQTQSVINFLCAISQRSLYVKHFPPINNNKIKLSSIYDEIEKFIKLRVSPDKEIADRNPYQFLDYYDLNDSDFFFDGMNLAKQY